MNIDTNITSYMKTSNGIIPATSPLHKDLLGIPKIKFVQVDLRVKNRLDLISYELYKNYQLWWVLMLFNDIINPDKWDNNVIYYIEPNQLLSLLEKHRVK